MEGDAILITIDTIIITFEEGDTIIITIEGEDMVNQFSGNTDKDGKNLGKTKKQTLLCDETITFISNRVR